MHVSVWLHGPVVPVPVPVPSHLDGFWLSILDRKKVNHTSKEARK